MIQGPILLGSFPKLLLEIRNAFHAAQMAGEFEAEKTEPTGAEWIVWSDEGFALVTYAGPGLAAVDCIYVRPAFRRQGIGGELLMAACGAARDQGVKALLLGLTNGNEAMRALVAAGGFDEAGVIVRKAL